jgi:hypothetical protein
MIGVGGSDWKHYVRRNPHVVKRRIRKGIPDCLRGLVWQLISGSRDLLLMNPGVYEVPIRILFFSCILAFYMIVICLVILDWETGEQVNSTWSGIHALLLNKIFELFKDYIYSHQHWILLNPILEVQICTDNSTMLLLTSLKFVASLLSPDSFEGTNVLFL